MGVTTTAECSVRGPGCRGERVVYGSGGADRLFAAGWVVTYVPPPGGPTLDHVRAACPECAPVVGGSGEDGRHV